MHTQLHGNTMAGKHKYSVLRILWPRLQWTFEYSDHFYQDTINLYCFIILPFYLLIYDILAILIYGQKVLANISLRIDNSGRSVIYTFYHNSETASVMITCAIPNKRGYFSSSFDICVIVIEFYLGFKQIKTDFLHFYFFNMDISFDIQVTEMKSLKGVKNIQIEGTVSQIFELGLGFDIMKKNG